MKNIPPTTNKLVIRLLSVALAFGILATDIVRSQSLLGGLTNTTQNLLQTVKVSNDLLDLVLEGKLTDRAEVIVQSNGPWNFTLDTLILILGGRVKQTYSNFNMRAVELPLGNVLQLATSLQVSYVSVDRQVAVLGHVSATSGAESLNTSETGTTGLDGTGIGIAVVDSGLYTAHRSFTGKTNNLRVVVSKDFTGEGRTDDAYGHGSHVAAIAAGNGKVANGAYIGIAPNANIINLRVLNAKGTGSSSGLLKALDWLITNRATYNIRVVNLSLGTAAVDSYRNDPICKAVRRLVDSGIVVAAAAGNNGRDAAGQKIYGQIHSPGNEPAAITVGASNTYGTDSRQDDSVTSYSSRGPTRSYWTDANNLKHYDNLIKPEIVAPGNKIISAEAINNLLVSQHPELDANVSSIDNR